MWQPHPMLGEWITSTIFNEVAALLVLAASVGFIGVLLKQPLIVSFIPVGILTCHLDGSGTGRIYA